MGADQNIVGTIKLLNYLFTRLVTLRPFENETANRIPENMLRSGPEARPSLSTMIT